MLDEEGRLVGVLTRDDAVRLELLRPALGASGELMVAAAVGISAQAPEIAAQLLEIGVSAIVLDTAHGHQRRMLEAIARGQRRRAGRVPMVAGNVCTAEGTRALLEAGADVVKVNVGPGAMCTTRMQTGAGRPTFTSVLRVRARGPRPRQARLGRRRRQASARRRALPRRGRRARDGRDRARRHLREPRRRQGGQGRPPLQGELRDGERPRGERPQRRAAIAFERAKKGFFREGISTSRIYIRDGQESVGAILVEMITGVQSAFTYVGARTLAEFHDRAEVGVQTPAGYGEGTPHGTVRR